MKMLRRMLMAASIALAAASTSQAQGTAAPEALNMAVYPGTLLSLPEYVGVAEGIYARHGIKPNLIPIPTGPGQIAALASGSVDIIGSTVGLMVLANNQGQDLVLLTNSFNAPLYTWVKQPGFNMPNLTSPYPGMIKDFKGAKIGISARGSEVELFTRVLLADAGLDPERDVIWVPVGFGQPAVAAFEAKQVDLLVTIEPVQSLLLARGTAQMVLDLRTGDAGPKVFRNFPGQSRMARRSVATSRAEAMKRFIKAQDEVLRFIADPKNAEAVAGHFTKASGLPPDIAKTITSGNRGVFSIALDCGGYANVLTYLERTGQFKPADNAKAPPCDRLIAPVSTALLKK